MASCLNPNGRAIQSMSTTLGDCNRSEKQNIGRKQTYQASKKPNPMFGKTSDTNLNRSGLQTRNKKPLGENKRMGIHQNRIQSTVEHYLKRAHQLLARIADEMQLPEDAYPPPDEVVRYMEQRAHQWKWATFRQYQASLVYRYAREYEKNGDPLFAKTAQALRVLSHKTCQPAHVIGHTSSRKRKGIPQRDFEALVARLSNPKQNSDY